MKNNSRSNNKKQNKAKGLSLFSSRLAILFIVLFAGIAAVLIISASAAKPVSNVVTLSLTTPSTTVRVGNTFGVDIWVNSNGRQINGVQADITYPTDRFEFVSIDATGSNLDVEAPSSIANGAISVVRGSTVPLNSGNIYVGKVNLRAVGSGRKVPVSLAPSSLVVSYSDSTNILGKTVGLKFNVQQ